MEYTFIFVNRYSIFVKHRVGGSRRVNIGAEILSKQPLHMLSYEFCNFYKLQQYTDQ